MARDILEDNQFYIKDQQARPVKGDHGGLSGLNDDDHPQYTLLVGRITGQTVNGGTGSGEDLTLQSTSHATKGSILFGTSSYDEVNNRMGINVTPLQPLHVNGTSLVTGTLGSDPVLPVLGAGVRSFFYTKKAAFRAGSWGAGAGTDGLLDANIGDNSMGVGYGVQAKGAASVALGHNTRADGDYSLGIGSANTVTSTASASTAIGTVNSVSSGNSCAIGSSNVIEPDGDSLFAIGASNDVYGVYGVTAIGTLNLTTADSTYVVVIGNQLESQNAATYGNVTIGNGGDLGNMVNAHDETVGIGINTAVPTLWVTGDKVGVTSNPTTITQRLQVDGGVRMHTATSRPTANANSRGTLWVVEGGAGVADTLQVCLKSAAGTYSWVTISTG